MRLMASVLVLAAVAGVASADGLVPPPKGMKHVTVTCEVRLGKEVKVKVKGYVFVQRATNGYPGTVEHTFGKVTLDEKKAWAAPAPTGKNGHVTLLAVPEDAANGFKTEKDLFEALEKEKVKG